MIGTNDLGNRQTVLGYHSTHSLVTRAYIESEGGYVGGQGKVFWDGYDHQYTSTASLSRQFRRRGAGTRIATRPSWSICILCGGRQSRIRRMSGLWLGAARTGRFSEVAAASVGERRGER